MANQNQNVKVRIFFNIARQSLTNYRYRYLLIEIWCAVIAKCMPGNIRGLISHKICDNNNLRRKIGFRDSENPWNCEINYMKLWSKLHRN